MQAKLEPNFQTNALDIEFSTLSNSDIYYTLDGKEPNTSSIKYNGKFNIKQDAEIKAAAFSNGKMSSKIFSEKLITSKSSYKPITLLTEPAKDYGYNGAALLVDGLYGSSNYKTGRWIGFQGNDLVVVIDLLQPTEISEVDFNTNVVTGDWIFDAEEISIESSNDNESFETVTSESGINIKDEQWQDVVNHHYTFDAVTARYFKVTIKSLDKMPEWHSGSGRKAFLFVDEIALN